MWLNSSEVHPETNHQKALSAASDTLGAQPASSFWEWKWIKRHLKGSYRQERCDALCFTVEENILEEGWRRPFIYLHFRMLLRQKNIYVLMKIVFFSLLPVV